MDIKLVITKVTASNRYDKLSQAARALAKQCNLPARVNCIKIDSSNKAICKSRTYPSVIMSIQHITKKNRKAKFAKAVQAVAKALDIPVELVHKHRGEPYFYHIQQQLADTWSSFYTNILQNIYTVVTTSLGLTPVKVETMRKALDDETLRYRGKILYSPETGEPIKQKDFDALIQAIEKFLNRNTKETGKRIVLDAVTIGKLLRRMAKYQTTQEMESLTIDDLKYRGKTFDWIRDDIKHIQEAFKIDGHEMSRLEMARYQVAMDYAAQKVTRVNNDVRDDIKDVILNGIVERRSKSQVSQDLFNRLGSLNRDWKRIADTELANTENLAGILEEVHQRPAGEKVYFKRYELPGCCDKCAAVDGKIVLWSDTPLSSDSIKDEYTDTALWDGKAQEKGKNVLVTGTLHPNCRGGWTPWGGKEVDAMLAKTEQRSEKWDEAVTKAREEYKARGIDNPDDQTTRYKERINELYRSPKE